MTLIGFWRGRSGVGANCLMKLSGGGGGGMGVFLFIICIFP